MHHVQCIKIMFAKRHMGYSALHKQCSTTAPKINTHSCIAPKMHTQCSTIAPKNNTHSCTAPKMQTY